MMMTCTIASIDEFIRNERSYRGYFIEKYMLPYITKYNITKACPGWISTDGRHIPDVQNCDTKLCNTGLARSIRDLIDHLYTFIDINGKLYWSVMPYTGEDCTKIEKRLLMNGIHPLAVTNYSPYGDVMILFDADDITAAYP